MTKTAIAIGVVMTVCTACATYNPPSATEGHALSQKGIHPGLGYIESVAVIPHAGSAAAGASAPNPNAYRLFLRMDNGGSQTVDQDNATFMAGERVEITPKGRVVRPAEGL